MKTKYMSCLTAALLSLGLYSCSRDDAGGGSVAPEGPVGVRIVVSGGDATRSVGSDATDNEIRRLRVYAFNGSGELTGYAMSDNLSGRNYLPITLSEGGETYFYVIANDHFGPNPTVNGVRADWTTLSRADLQDLVFDLSGFAGWTVNNGESISPLSNNRYREDGSEFTGKYENDFATAVDVTEDRQVIPVTVQHVLGRLRLFLYKDASLGDEYAIKLTRAAVYRRPDAFRLYYSVGNAITYDNNSDALVDEFVSSDIVLAGKPADGDSELARTFLAPNIYGSGDETGSAPAADEDKAYRLVLTIARAYQGGGWASKDYTVYLPPVSRNASIDVQGIISAEVENLAFNVMTNVWTEKNMDIPTFE